MTPDAVDLEDCHGAIQSACSAAKKSGIGVAVVDRCLRFVAASNTTMEGLDCVGVAHLFYHLDGKNRVCRLSNPGERDAELKALDRFLSMLISSNTT